ncbi:MAG: methyltransferase domain-containing protein [Hyphomicrobiaceae bacterium]|nr:methyltransferase domain-containing protein [Hyphomicrobiaceae bacterium]
MTRSLVERQFGPGASAYGASEVHRAGESLKRIVEMAGPQAHWRVLDVATGAGHTAATFAPHVAEVVASDITAEMLAETARIAAEKGLSNLSTVRAAADELAFPAGSFDLVTCRLAAHHFPDVPAFVAAARRVLKSGGRLAVVDNVTPDAANLPGLSAGALADAGHRYNAFEKLRDPSHGRALSQSEWVAIVTADGFEVAAVEQMKKAMAFEAYVARMRCDGPTRERLLTLLTTDGPLKTFLEPREDRGELMFTLREMLLVAHAPD